MVKPMDFDTLEELLETMDVETIRQQYGDRLAASPPCMTMLEEFEALDDNLDFLKNSVSTPALPLEPARKRRPWLVFALPLAALLVLAIVLKSPETTILEKQSPVPETIVGESLREKPDLPKSQVDELGDRSDAPPSPAAVDEEKEEDAVADDAMHALPEPPAPIAPDTGMSLDESKKRASREAEKIIEREKAESPPVGSVTPASPRASTEVSSADESGQRRDRDQLRLMKRKQEAPGEEAVSAEKTAPAASRALRHDVQQLSIAEDRQAEADMPPVPQDLRGSSRAPQPEQVWLHAFFTAWKNRRVDELIRLFDPQAIAGWPLLSDCPEFPSESCFKELIAAFEVIAFDLFAKSNQTVGFALTLRSCDDGKTDYLSGTLTVQLTSRGTCVALTAP